MRVIVTGGGTGGHIYPGLTLLKHMEKQMDHLDVLYIGSEKGLEKDLVKRAGLNFAAIPAAGLKRQLSLSGLKTFWTTYCGYRRAKRLVKDFRPDVVVGTGGYVTLPVVFAASSLNVPAVIWEGNARPGLTNQLCARRAYGVAVCFEDSQKWFAKAHKVVFTGNPRASEVLSVTRTEIHQANRAYGLAEYSKSILCFAGSRGAETVNEVLSKMMSRFGQRPEWQLIYVTGDKHYEQVRGHLGEVPGNVKVVPFIHDMPALLPQVSAVVTRAGSSTLAEICSFGIPSILIPSPYVTANHQEENAKRLVARGAAVMIREASLTPDSLWDALTKVLDNNTSEKLRKAAKDMATPNAVEALYKLVDEAVHQGRAKRR